MFDFEVYVYCIGCIGCVDQDGWVLSFVSMDEMGCVGVIEQVQKCEVEWYFFVELKLVDDSVLLLLMEMLQIFGGCKDKICLGDVFGVLIGDVGFDGKQIGKINVIEFLIYVVIECGVVCDVLCKFNVGKIKGKCVKVWLMDEE